MSHIAYLYNVANHMRSHTHAADPLGTHARIPYLSFSSVPHNFPLNHMPQETRCSGPPLI